MSVLPLIRIVSSASMEVMATGIPPVRLLLAMSRVSSFVRLPIAEASDPRSPLLGSASLRTSVSRLLTVTPCQLLTRESASQPLLLLQESPPAAA